MARDQRTNSKVRDLEGLNRQLEKRLKKAYKDIARLQKLLDRASANIDSDDKGIEEPVAKDATELPGKCTKCGSLARVLNLSNIKGSVISYQLCTNSNCCFRKKI